MSFSIKKLFSFNKKKKLPDGLNKSKWNQIENEYKKLNKKDLEFFLAKIYIEFSENREILNFIKDNLKTIKNNITSQEINNILRNLNRQKNESIRIEREKANQERRERERANQERREREREKANQERRERERANQERRERERERANQERREREREINKQKELIINIASNFSENNELLMKEAFEEYKKLNKNIDFDLFKIFVSSKKSFKSQESIKEDQQNKKNQRGFIHRRTGYPVTNLLKGKPLINYLTVNGKGPFHRKYGYPVTNLFKKRKNTSSIPKNSVPIPKNLESNKTPEHIQNMKNIKTNEIRNSIKTKNPLLLINLAEQYFLRNNIPSNGDRSLYVPEVLFRYFPFRDYFLSLRRERNLGINCLITRNNSLRLTRQQFLENLRNRTPPYYISNVKGDGYCSIWAFIFGYFMNYNNFNNTRLEPFIRIAYIYINQIKHQNRNNIIDFNPRLILLSMHFYFLWIGNYYYNVFLGLIPVENIQNKFERYSPYSVQDLQEINDLIHLENTREKIEIIIKTYFGFKIVSSVFNIDQIMITENDYNNNVLQFFITANDSLTRNIGTVDYIIFNYLSMLVDTPFCLYRVGGGERQASSYFNGIIENIKEKIDIYGSGGHFYSINIQNKYTEFEAQNRNKSLAIIWWNNMSIARDRLRINRL